MKTLEINWDGDSQAVVHRLTTSTIVNVHSTSEKLIFLTIASSFHQPDQPPIRPITKLIGKPKIPHFVINVAEQVNCNIFIIYEAAGYLCKVINAARGAKVNLTGINISTNDVFCFVQCNLKQDSVFNNKCLTVSTVKKHKIWQVEMNHFGSNSTGVSMYRQFVKAGTVEVNCISNIQKKSDDCVAQQKLKSILLSKNATAINRPILNIFNRNVIATHASAIGCVNPAEIYYLNSRGFTKESAVLLIIKGYVAEIFKGVNTEIRDRFINKISELLSISCCDL